MPGQNLTREEAAARADLLAVDAYDVALDLSRAADAAQETFRSTTTVRFRAAAGATTFIDLIAPRVRSIVLNGRELDPAETYVDSRIVLGDLAPDNELTVVADCAYMRTRPTARPTCTPSSRCPTPGASSPSSSSPISRPPSPSR